MSYFAFIEANGERIAEWTSYSVDSDLMTPADGFSFDVEVPGDTETRERLLELTKPGTEIKIFVGDDVGGGPRERFQQMVGIIDDRTIGASREGGTVIQIEGRDLAGILTDASVELNLNVSADMRLIDLVREAVGFYGIEVVTDSYAAQRTLQGGGRTSETQAARRAGVAPSRFSFTQQEEATRTGRSVDGALGTDEELREEQFTATGDRLDTITDALASRRGARSGYANIMGPGDIERLTVKDARPQVGETIWAFIERHCTRLGVLLWCSPLGRLILSSPRYNQEPRYRAVRRYVEDTEDPNNVRDGKLIESIGDRHSKVVVYGRGNIRSTERTPVSGEAVDDSWPAELAKPLYLQETDLRTADACARKALRELMRFRRDAFQLEYTLDDHGQRGYLYAIDSTIRVIDEPIGVDGTFYITKRTFRKDRDQGTSTTIRAVPLRSLVY